MLDERFLMLNGDVLTDIDLTAQIAQHERTGARGTLALVPVEDPSAYGVVVLDDDHAVREFVEKPEPGEVDSNLISAGAYVLEREILELVPPDSNVSIEREVWPALVGDGLYGFPSESYWLDIGTPDRYLQGTFDIIEGNVQTAVRPAAGQRLAGDARRRRGTREGDSPGGARARRPDRRGGPRGQPGGARRGCLDRSRKRRGAGRDPRGEPDRRRMRAA